MTDWQEIIDADFAVPAGIPLADLVAELSEALRSPDPVLRDEQAATVLAHWVPELDERGRERLGDELAARFRDPEIQARTFAPLLLAVVVAHGSFRPEWVEAFASWYRSETDLRGYDAELGWLHAVAHGADLLRVLGLDENVSPPAMIDLAVDRMLAPTDFVWADQEDDRLAYALAMTLTRPSLTEAQALGWLDRIAAAFAEGEPGPVPAFASNTMRTLRTLYMLVDRGVRPRRPDAPVLVVGHRDSLKSRLADVLAVPSPSRGDRRPRGSLEA